MLRSTIPRVKWRLWKYWLTETFLWNLIIRKKLQTLFIFCAVVFVLPYITSRPEHTPKERGNVKTPLFYCYGDMGMPVTWDKKNREIAKEIKEGMAKHKYNKYASDLVPKNRRLPVNPDPRCSWYAKKTILEEVSVIICFYNEALSALKRTVYSILNRTPPHLLKEIVLVDDGSTSALLKCPLSEEWSENPKVKIIRSERQGIMQARMLGVKMSTAPILVFMDSHSEVTEGWLEPLLDRIMKKPNVVASPLIDSIDSNTMEYLSAHPNMALYFGWDLQAFWKKLEHDRGLSPFQTPIIAGGIYAIKRDLFLHLNVYDNDLKIWGGDNIELSFKAWMCGGELEIVPCSRVGHIFVRESPYFNDTSVFYQNLAKVAMVWMDEYAKYFFYHYNANDYDLGMWNVTDLIEKKKALKCHSFDWYMTNVFPELLSPEHFKYYGLIKVKGTDSCMANTNHTWHSPLKMEPCNGLGGNQFWILSEDGKLMQGSNCAKINREDHFTIDLCGEGEDDTFKYIPSKFLLKHMNTDKCCSVQDNLVTLDSCTFAMEWEMYTPFKS